MGTGRASERICINFGKHKYRTGASVSTGRRAINTRRGRINTGRRDRNTGRGGINTGGSPSCGWYRHKPPNQLESLFYSLRSFGADVGVIALLLRFARDQLLHQLFYRLLLLSTSTSTSTSGITSYTFDIIAFFPST